MHMIYGACFETVMKMVGDDDDDDDDDKVLTGDVIAENARRDDVATGAEQPLQVRLEKIVKILPLTNKSSIYVVHGGTM